MSYSSEVIADNTGKWVGNGLRFGTNAEAWAYGNDLARRWTMVRQTRVVESDAATNAIWIDGKVEQK